MHIHYKNKCDKCESRETDIEFQICIQPLAILDTLNKTRQATNDCHILQPVFGHQNEEDQLYA